MNELQTTWAAALAGLLLAAPLAVAQAQGTQLNPPAARISDEAIQADQRAFETLQARIKGVNDKGRPVKDYHLSKAQCWLDVSFHEYTRNDRSTFVQEAMTESEKLIAGMERGTALGNDTPLVGQAIKLRPDLWDRIAGLKNQPGFRCSAHKLACAEVELVHAGNEHAQQQWRHAKPYVQIAEDLVAEAEILSKDCPGAVLPEVAEYKPPPPPVPVPLREVSIVAHVVFSFDRHEESDIRGHSMAQLRALVERIRSSRLDVQAIRLTGHADRLNSTGQTDYNQRLSERRVQTVSDVLVRLGVDPKLITTAARGDTQQVEDCKSGYRSQAELQECLLPNRRVEIEVQARAPN
jgi:outer membrane protein OmpA-like peptidoglycan-associated protein